MSLKELSPLIGLGVVTSFLSIIPWTCVFLITRVFGIRLYLIHKKEDCIRIQKNIGVCSHITDGDKPYGYSVGFWYIASITVSKNEYNQEHSVWIVGTPSSYRRLTQEKDIEIRKMDTNFINIHESAPFKVMERFGSNSGAYYRPRMLRLSIEPRLEQQNIINDIQYILGKKKSAVILIHGPPGIGKTMVSLILANETKGIYCNNLRPWDAGESIASVYTEAEPTEMMPLIIAFDEIDGALEEIHRGIPSHKNLKIQVQNKQGWNQMLDEIQMGFYPHLVVIMTTNKSPDFIRRLDDSYIREHRVDRIYGM
jgi:hypothetical protein